VRHSPDKPADPIIAHPDVRRMLLTQKAFAEGGRVLCAYCSMLVDVTLKSEDEAARQQADTLLAFLTPVTKAFLSEVAIESTNLGLQVLGGHGYVSEWGQEQHVRDTRITAIYEGTTGIQALDLLGRKILGTGGAVLEPFTDAVTRFCTEHGDNPWAQKTGAALQDWLVLTEETVKASMAEPDHVNAAAVDYLMYTGYVVMAWCWSWAAITAEQKLDSADSDADRAFYRAKLSTARFYFERLLPRTQSLAATIRSGPSNLTDLNEAHFIF
jgi:hypothetical protein